MGLKLFSTAFLQVFFVAANTNMIAKNNFIGILICSFLVSYIWAYNVRAISIASVLEKIIYAGGAMTGSIVGVLLSSFVTNLF